MQSPFWSAWESIRTETLEPWAGAVVTRGPWCFRSCPCTHLGSAQFWSLTCLFFFVLFLFLALFTFLLNLYLPGLLLDIVWCLDFGIKPLALTFPCQFRSIFNCSWFLSSGLQMLVWMDPQHRCLSLVNSSWFEYQQGLKIAVSTWNTFWKISAILAFRGL